MSKTELTGIIVTAVATAGILVHTLLMTIADWWRDRVDNKLLDFWELRKITETTVEQLAALMETKPEKLVPSLRRLSRDGMLFFDGTYYRRKPEAQQVRNIPF